MSGRTQTYHRVGKKKSYARDPRETKPGENKQKSKEETGLVQGKTMGRTAKKKEEKKRRCATNPRRGKKKSRSALHR